MKCENVNTGCDWEGTVGTLKEHATKCAFALFSCPNKCEDDGGEVQHFLRKDLDKHVDEDCPNRMYKCEDCGCEDTYTYITKSHHEDCPVIVLPCPKRPCTEMLQRQYLERHIETECKHAVVCCKYRGLGCEREMKRGDMAVHEEDDKLHLHMAIDMTAKLSAEFREDREKLFNKISTLEDEKVKLLDKMRTLESNSITVKVVDVQDGIDRVAAIGPSFFHTSPEGYFVSLDVFPAGYSESVENLHLSVDLTLLSGSYDDDLSWPLIADVTITLLNQLEDKNHYSKMTPVNVERNRYGNVLIEYPIFILHSELGFNPVRNTQYLKDDALYFRVSFKLNNNWLKCSNV